MLIDPVPLFSQIFITLFVSMTTMKWTGLFHTIFIFDQELLSFRHLLERRFLLGVLF